MLNRFGVDFIEVGHPAVSKDIYSFIEKVSEINLNAKIIAHSRLLKSDIDQIIDLNVPWIGLFFDISENHLEKKYGLNEEKALEMIIDSISYAKRHRLKVRFTAEDASRTNFDFLIKIAKLIAKIMKRVNPPEPLIKLLAVIITAVGVGKATPIPSYISAKTGTTFINMKTITVIATTNITTG